MAGSYYNEIDPFAAHCLRGLIADGVIAPGDVDERSIVDVQPDDLKGYTQCHFFAGGGLWSVAARMAGISDDKPIWTGSCPCQSLSVAGQGKGADDERHLWPAFFRLISECKPAIVFGEQVASKLGREWFAGVRLDMESLGYASGAADLCAAGVGAPHIRQRLYWVAQDVGFADGAGRDAREFAAKAAGHRDSAVAGSSDCIVDNTASTRQSSSRGWQSEQSEGRERLPCVGCLGDDGDMADAESIGRRWRQDDENEGRREQSPADPRARGGDVGNAARNDKQRDRERDAGENGAGEVRRSGLRNGDMAHADGMQSGRGQLRFQSINRGHHRTSPEQEFCAFWSDAEWRRGADGKARRVKSGLCLLADGIPGRVGKIRIAGNAIVPQVAAAFMTAALEAARQ